MNAVIETSISEFLRCFNDRSDQISHELYIRFHFVYISVFSFSRFHIYSEELVKIFNGIFLLCIFSQKLVFLYSIFSV